MGPPVPLKAKLRAQRAWILPAALIAVAVLIIAFSRQGAVKQASNLLGLQCSAEISKIEEIGRKLETLQQASETKAPSAYVRSLVFNTPWGRQAADALQTWRSTLFLRMAQLYTQEEKKGDFMKWNFGVDRVEPDRYDIAAPIIQCPNGPTEWIGGGGEGSKKLCAQVLDQPGCVIYSLGSNGNFKFEEAMMKATTCEIHTLDCTCTGESLDGKQRHFYHQVCLGRETTSVQGNGTMLEFWDYPTLISNLGHQSKVITLLKIDIEAFEFDVLSGWKEQDSCSLPLQIAMEVHYAYIYNLMPDNMKVAKDDFTHLFWPWHVMSMAEVGVWFNHFANLGYAITEREITSPTCCAEMVLLKVEQSASCPSSK